MVFSEFINGKNTSDEIYFYLCCRDAINEGPTLSDRKNCFEMIQREPIEKTIKMVRKILDKFPDRDADSIIAKLRESSVLKQNGKEYLDAGFVLKVLLELYRADKKIRYEYMERDYLIQKKLQEVLPNSSPLPIKKETSYLSSYENFRKFSEKNFPLLGETDKLEFFCECYNVGGGDISFETYYTIVHEYGLLIGDMKVKQLILDHSNTQTNIDYQYYQNLKKNQSKEYKMRDLIISKMDGLGVERMAHEIKIGEGSMDGSKYSFGWKETVVQYTHLMSMRCKVNMLSLIEMPNIQDEVYISNKLAEHTGYFISMFEVSKKYQAIAKTIQENYQKAADIINRFTKRVLHKDNWYMLMQMLLNMNYKKDSSPDNRSTILNGISMLSSK